MYAHATPLPVLVPSLAVLHDIAHNYPPRAGKHADRFDHTTTVLEQRELASIGAARFDEFLVSVVAYGQHVALCNNERAALRARFTR